MSGRGHALPGPLDDERAHPLVARVRVGLRDDELVVGDRRVRDPVLLAVQDVGVALAARGRPHRGDVGAGARLGQPEAAELLALRLRDEVALLLLLGAVLEQRQRVQPDVDGDQRPERRLAALDLLAGERLRDEVEPRAAVLLRDDDPEDPELGHPLDQLQVELVVDVVLDGDRQDALVHEGADGVLDQPLLVGELEVHAGESTPAADLAQEPERARPPGADQRDEEERAGERERPAGEAVHPHDEHLRHERAVEGDAEERVLGDPRRVRLEAELEDAVVRDRDRQQERDPARPAVDDVDLRGAVATGACGRSTPP